MERVYGATRPWLTPGSFFSRSFPRASIIKLQNLPRPPCLVGSSPESLGMMGMLLPVLLSTDRFSSGHFSTPLFLSSKGRLSEAKTTPFPFKHSPKRRTEGFFLLPHLLCLIFPALLFRVAANCFKGWREGAWGHKLFFYNTKLCFWLPTPTPLPTPPPPSWFPSLF